MFREVKRPLLSLDVVALTQHDTHDLSQCRVINDLGDAARKH